MNTELMSQSEYLQTAIYEAQRAISFFNSLHDQRRLEYFIIHMHVALNRLLISYFLKSYNQSKIINKNGRVLSFSLLLNMFQKEKIISEDNGKIIALLNELRNQIMHNYVKDKDLSEKHFDLFFNIVEIFKKINRKVDKKNLLKGHLIIIDLDNHPQIININEKIVSKEKFSYSRLIDEYLDENSVYITKYTYSIDIEEGKYTYSEAAKEIARYIEGFKIQDQTHIRRVFNIMGENHKKINYKDVPSLEYDKEYGLVFKHQKLLLQKFVSDVIELCKKNDNWKTYFKNMGDKKETLDIEILKNTQKLT